MADITASTRYFPVGVRKIYWCPTIATQSSPTRSELTTSGTNLTPEIAEMSGFSVTSDTVEVPDMSSLFNKKLPGRTNAEDSSLRFWASSNSTDVRSILTQGTAGFIVTLWEGDVPTQKMDVWPVKVSYNSMQTGIDDPASIEVGFTITGTPSKNVTIPA